MSAYSMTGQTVSPRSFAAAISSTRAATRASTTAKTSSTVRPDASMRARRAALISRSPPEVGRGGLPVRQRRQGGVDVAGEVMLDSFGEDSLLEVR